MSEQRVIRILTRRTGASAISLKPLSGGLSDAKTLRAECKTAEGRRTALLAVKLGELARILKGAPGYGFPPGVDPGKASPLADREGVDELRELVHLLVDLGRGKESDVVDGLKRCAAAR